MSQAPELDQSVARDDDTELHIRASQARYIAFSGAMMVVINMGVTFIYTGGHADLWVALLCGLPTFPMLIMFGRAKSLDLSVRNQTLIGPRRYGGERVSIRFEDIDRELSTKTGWFGGRTIWARNGESIGVDAVAFPRAERVRLFRALGLE